MSLQLVAIFAVLGFALLILLMGWSALAASAREEHDQQRWIETMAAAGWQEWQAESPSANGDYPASDDAKEQVETE